MGRQALAIILVLTLVVSVPAAASLSFIDGPHAGSASLPASSLNGISGQALFRNAFMNLTHHYPGTGYSHIANHKQVEQHYYSIAGFSPANQPFSPVKQSIAFREKGLPTNTSWFVDVGGTNYTTTGNLIGVSLDYGNYSYYSGNTNGYMPLTGGGTISVPSKADEFNITFVSSLSVNSTLFLSNNTLARGNYPVLSANNAPIGIISDPANNLTYVADSSSNLVYAIGNSGKIMKKIHVGQSPSELLFEPSNRLIYVSNSGSDNISVIGAGNNVVNTIDAGQFPFGIAYDPSNGLVYAANVFSSNITVIDPSASPDGGKVSGSIMLPSSVMPFSVAYDGSNGRIYVSNTNGSNLYAVSGYAVAGSVQVYGSPAMMAYDSSNGNLYVTDSETSPTNGYGHLSVINPDGSLSANIAIKGSQNPFGVTYDKQRNLLYISDANANTLIEMNPQSGIIVGSVNVGSQPYGVVSSPSSQEVIVTNFGSGTVTFIGYKSNVEPVIFTETGLSAGMDWSARMNGASQQTTGRNIYFNETPGVYSYSVHPPAGYASGYQIGSLLIAHSPVNVSVTFKSLYDVTVHRTGLPANTEWGFTLNGTSYASKGPSITIELTNGTYGIIPFASANATSTHYVQLTVNGGPTGVTLSYSLSFLLTFKESGLPGGTEWSVNIGNSTYSSRNSTMGIMLVNGTYGYAVFATGSYAISKPVGSISIEGSPESIMETFTELYQVKFMGHGLFPGTSWSVTLNGTGHSSITNSITFTVKNGTYKFSAGLAVGYRLLTGNGTVNVQGGNVSMAVHYARLYNVTLAETGLPHSGMWSLKFNGNVLNPGGTNISLEETNGTYSYSSTNIAGYSVMHRSGTVVVSGGPANISIIYLRIYQVSFDEAGLPSGTSWSVALGSITSHSNTGGITFNETNGTYRFSVQSVYGYMANKSSGTVSVNGHGATVHIMFSRDIGNITFNSLNIPDSQSVHVFFNGKFHNYTDGTGYASAIYGMYNYSAYYTLHGNRVEITGKLLLDTPELNVTLAFPKLYSVQFHENGLVQGGSWSVNMSGYNFTSSGSTILFLLANGTYNFTISSSTGQPFHVMINYGDDSGDAAATAMITSVGTTHSNAQSLLVNGENITAHVVFTHSSEGSGHGWQYYAYSLGSGIVQLFIHVGEMVQVALIGLSFALRFGLSRIIPPIL